MVLWTTVGQSPSATKPMFADAPRRRLLLTLLVNERVANEYELRICFVIFPI